jgi:hypothetical protein
MHVALTSEQLNALVSEYYAGESKPLSLVKGEDRPDDVTWWQSSPKRETFSSERHSAAASFYARLGTLVVPDAVAHEFPALLVTRDGKRFRPDKGFVKACLGNDPALLRVETRRGELVFVLTQAGLERMV